MSILGSTAQYWYILKDISQCTTILGNAGDVPYNITNRQEWDETVTWTILSNTGQYWEILENIGQHWTKLGN